jgi:hypothetical protein
VVYCPLLLSCFGEISLAKACQGPCRHGERCAWLTCNAPADALRRRAVRVGALDRSESPPLAPRAESAVAVARAESKRVGGRARLLAAAHEEREARIANSPRARHRAAAAATSELDSPPGSVGEDARPTRRPGGAPCDGGEASPPPRVVAVEERGRGPAAAAAAAAAASGSPRAGPSDLAARMRDAEARRAERASAAIARGPGPGGVLQHARERVRTESERGKVGSGGAGAPPPEAAAGSYEEEDSRGFAAADGDQSSDGVSGSRDGSASYHDRAAAASARSGPLDDGARRVRVWRDGRLLATYAVATGRPAHSGRRRAPIDADL